MSHLQSFVLMPDGWAASAGGFPAQGHRVAAIDRKNVGGSCPNIVCLPSKTSFPVRKLHRTLAEAKSSV